MGKVQDDVMHDWNNTPTQQHVQSFYMDETEVTNFMYLEYLDWLKMCSQVRKVINIFMKVLHLIL
jgi:formylglycine-generating enzyme required for sulfatase activity